MTSEESPVSSGNSYSVQDILNPHDASQLQLYHGYQTTDDVYRNQVSLSETKFKIFGG